ncbi:hypothetical protein C8J56DRAFT_926719 [Mycena floridula]|nr:hypothetical protein C8J56DRAFT_926719 [Mycena floridula]
MPMQIETATPCQLSSISDKLVGCKLRVAGKMLCHDPETGYLVLVNGRSRCGLLVDASLCIDAQNRWLREHLSILMVLGYLEGSEDALSIPSLPPHAQSYSIPNQFLILKALLVSHIPDLELDAWDSSIDAI